jgi:hypothetical protein
LVSVISARQFRQVVKVLAPDVAPTGYWTYAGVVLNIVIALIAAALALHFMWPTGNTSTSL